MFSKNPFADPYPVIQKYNAKQRVERNSDLNDYNRNDNAQQIIYNIQLKKTQSFGNQRIKAEINRQTAGNQNHPNYVNTVY